ncbi:MAG: PQQ-binding-like beta-propeller repeat protein, partial [candidate division WOR-3 bacterium]
MLRSTIVLLLTIAFSFCLASDWTTVGGNSQHNGLSDCEGPVQGAIVHQGWSPYSTLGMQVYAAGLKAVTMRYDFGTMTGTLACHQLPFGETCWTRVYGPAQSKILPIGFRDNRIYCRNFRETGNDTVYCINPEDGSILWQSRWTVERGIVWAANYTPEGNIILAGSGSVILCLNKETGDTVWTRYRPLPNTGAEWMCVYDTILYTWKGF